MTARPVAGRYNNPWNTEAHYLTTGPEIHTQTRGAITHFVMAVRPPPPAPEPAPRAL